MSKTQFLTAGFLSLLRQYITLDVIDTINKSRTWNIRNPHPITTLPFHEQIVFSISVCIGILLSITLPYTVTSCLAVCLGSHPSSWPPMFNAPFTSTSLVDFWTRRWHAIFRHVFGRLSTAILYVLPIPNYKPLNHKARTIRAIVIFGLSGYLHIMLMHRVINMGHPRTFLDPSILKFFLLQPMGLVMETLVVVPLCDATFGVRWRNTITRAWTWMFMLFLGRYWSDVWVSSGLWDENEKVVGISLIRGIIKGQWITYIKLELI